MKSRRITEFRNETSDRVALLAANSATATNVGRERALNQRLSKG
jgi:hypothetical protein